MRRRGRRRTWREGRREGEPKEQEAEEHEGTSRVEQWPKIAGQNQRGIKGNRAGEEGFKIADLHKTRGYPRPLFSPSRAKRTFGDAVTLRREGRGATYNGSKMPARRANSRGI